MEEREAHERRVLILEEYLFRDHYDYWGECVHGYHCFLCRERAECD